MASSGGVGGGVSGVMAGGGGQSSSNSNSGASSRGILSVAASPGITTTCSASLGKEGFFVNQGYYVTRTSFNFIVFSFVFRFFFHLSF